MDTPHNIKEHRLTRTPSGLHVAYNRGYPDTWQTISDILSNWACKEKSRYMQFQNMIETSAFTYVDSSNDNKLVLDNVPDGIKHIYQVVDRQYTNYICDKLEFSRAAKRAGLEGVVVPRSFETKEEAIEKLAGTDVELVFVKDFHGTYGSGISVERTENLPNLDLPIDHLIQEGLTKNLALLEGKKVTLRTFFIIMHGAVYCHRTGGWAVVQERSFDPTSPEKEVQVSHHNYTLTPLHEFPNYTIWIDGFVEMGKKAGPMLKRIVKATARDPLCFSYLGVDLIPFVDGSVKMLEINSYPAFRRADVMADIILWISGMEHYDDELDSQMVKVWELSDHEL